MHLPSLQRRYSSDPAFECCDSDVPPRVPLRRSDRVAFPLLPFALRRTWLSRVASDAEFAVFRGSSSNDQSAAQRNPVLPLLESGVLPMRVDTRAS